jgi:hypothetical protein
MNILGIGPLEILLIMIVAFAFIGPKDMAKTGRTVGRFLRKIVISSEWRALRYLAHEIQTTPNRLIREAGIDEIEQMRQELNSLGVLEMKGRTAANYPDFEELDGYAAWTQQPAPRRIMPDLVPPTPESADPGASQANSQSDAK